ncbi:hypothetical protein X797_010620 [Metarhizium robertsii]|uniref:Transcription factor Zn, C2H2 n=2 Tax=Metarhizium robertsii TaxID=568076 RepID=E9FC08_METRA|nr:transcription factor Zn, C2H2 [Metarhizium robertsii ARSEF 23]EFY94683.1 transcription factor Zn, C2H2 [Metarhizium robertsii ARSEF 23]EXU96359.1 hypothetical protein X797_010620 [Metarhizium robertsii]
MAKADDHIGTFFAAYPDFDYEPTNEVWSEYRRLVKHYGWKTKSQKEKEANAAFRIALVEQFGSIYGTDENKLEALQRLCEKLGIDPIPTSITACKKAIKRIHVNIVDFVDSERTGEPVYKFGSVGKLAKYTWENGKVFPKKEAKRSNLLRFLLRCLHH